MYLRSGNVVPPGFENWKFEPEYSDCESSDTGGKRKQKKKQGTKVRAPAAVRTEGVCQTQSQTSAAQEVPSWVPVRLPSCVPGPRFDTTSNTSAQAVAAQQLLPSQDLPPQKVKTEYQTNDNSQTWLPMMSGNLLQAAQMPPNLLNLRLGENSDLNATGVLNKFAGMQPQLPWILGDDSYFVGNGFDKASEFTNMTGMSGSLLPCLPLGIGGNPFLDFGLHPLFSMAANGSRLNVSGWVVLPSLRVQFSVLKPLSTSFFWTRPSSSVLLLCRRPIYHPSVVPSLPSRLNPTVTLLLLPCFGFTTHSFRSSLSESCTGPLSNRFPSWPWSQLPFQFLQTMP